MEYKINDKVYNMSSNLTDFQIKLYAHLIDWKHKQINKKRPRRGHTLVVTAA